MVLFGSPERVAFRRILGSTYRDVLVLGGVFFKHGRRGAPHARYVWVDGDLLAVHWRSVSSRGGLASVSSFSLGGGGAGGSGSGSGGHSDSRGTMLVSSLRDVVAGRVTPVFARTAASNPGRDGACFSLIGDDRTLDLELIAGALAGAAAGPAGANAPGSSEGAAAAVAAAAAAGDEVVAVRDRWVAAFRWLISAAAPCGAARSAAPSLGHEDEAEMAGMGSGHGGRDDTVRQAGQLGRGGSVGGRLAASFGRLIRTGTAASVAGSERE
jgi:hypothetical protein